MPKLKTHKSTAKRIKKRGGSGLKRRNSFSTHLLGGRSTKRKRGMRKNEPVSPADAPNARRALGLR